MKKIFFALILALVSSFSFAQNDLSKVNIPKQEATYIGGQEAMNSYLTKNLTLSKGKKIIEGITYIKFTVDQNGNVVDAKILKGFDANLDAIALNAVQKMPKWNPALDKNDKVINSEVVLPIKFKN